MAVDPGLRGCGVSHWDKGELRWARYVKSPNKKDRGPKAWDAMAYQVAQNAGHTEIDLLLCEIPQIYRGPFQKGDPADLIEIAGVVGSIVGTLALVTADFEGVLPRDWKGQTPKNVHHERIRAKLNTNEIARIDMPAVSLQHNVWDAVGLGLWYVTKTKERK